MFTATMFLYVLGLEFNRIFPRGLIRLLRSVKECVLRSRYLHLHSYAPPLPTQFYADTLEQTMLQGLECSGTMGPTLGAQVPAVDTCVTHPAVTKSKGHRVSAAWCA